MKKNFLTVFGAAMLLTSAMAFPAYAQSDGVINYSDTFTDSGSARVYIDDGVDISGPVHLFNSSDFTFSVDMNNLMQTEYSKFNNEKYTVSHSIWMGIVTDSAWISPITSNPYYEDDIEVKEVGNGVYSLEGLDIKEDTVYAIMVEMWGSRVYEPNTGGANAGGGAFASVEPSYFKIASANNVTNGDQTSGGDSENDIYYYWMNNETGWWVQCSNGTYLTNHWYQSPVSGLWYYMGNDGYMLTNTTTPDGYYVNSDGVWVQ